MDDKLVPCSYNEKLVRLKDVNDALTAQFMDSPLDSDRWVIGRIQFRINAIPAVDAVEVRHGRWVGYPECLRYVNAYSDDHIVCSECEECFSILDNDAERFDYCPHCGARMDGEEEHNAAD